MHSLSRSAQESSIDVLNTAFCEEASVYTLHPSFDDSHSFGATVPIRQERSIEEKAGSGTNQEESSQRPRELDLDGSGWLEEGPRLVEEQTQEQEEDAPSKTLTWDRLGSVSYPPFEEEQISWEERGRLLDMLEWMEGEADKLKRPGPS